MQEIEHGTNEAAYKHKMAKMKEVAEMLEAKVGSLEEGEGADFVDARKVKQMKKDIMTLRKQAEKLEKEYDKKFAKKEGKKEVVVFTTKRNDYKKTLSPNGYGSSDLKSNILEFYVGLIKQYGTNITTRAVSFNNHEMEYVVKVN
jgi:hypothetical protein